MSRKRQSIGPPDGALGSFEIIVLACRCRCGHEWIARERDRPRVCPKCKSPNWDREKLYERTNSKSKARIEEEEQDKLLEAIAMEDLVASSAEDEP